MDRETVITHLQIIHTWAEFARERNLQFFTAKHLEDIAQWADDALELLKQVEKPKFLAHEDGTIEPLPIVFPNCPLKEHEAVEPIRINTNYEQHWKCGNCKAVISVQDKYCHECGKRIEWEGR